MSDILDKEKLLKLCWLIDQQNKAQYTYNRAKYQVSYYRKLRAKINKTKDLSLLQSFKWNSLAELKKVIEAKTLTRLEKQKNLLDVKQKVKPKIISLTKKLCAECIYNEQNTVIVVCSGNFFYTEKQIAEMADEYEANITLDKILKKKTTKNDATKM